MPNRTPIISFIVPVYNAELYIEDCLNSIIGQKSFCDCELICVDDKSTDRSCGIIVEYEKQYPNIRLIHHDTNKKAGGARNTGIKASRGQYIWFVDSDDMIVDGSLGKIVTQLKTNDLDVFCFNYSLKYEDSEQICEVFKESAVKSGYQFIETQWGQKIIYYLGYPVIAVFRKSVVTDSKISFVENTTYGEDTTFITEVIAESSRVASTAESFYNYRQGHTSSTSLLMKSWRGAQIYESIFVAGNLIYNNLIERHRGRYPEFCANIEYGMPWFVNRMFFRLLRSSLSERSVFYKKIVEDRGSTIHVTQYMNRLNRFIVNHPGCSRLLMNVASPIYLAIHKNKRRCTCR